MRNKITTLLLLMCCVTFTYAQYTTLDVEPAGTGNGIDWDQFGNSPTPDNTTLPSVANPVSGGINTSATVYQFDVNSTAGGAAFWGGASTENIDGLFTFDATNTTVKLKVYSTSASIVRVKFEAAGGGGTAVEADQTTAGAGAWEELTFDFSGANGNGQTYGRLVIFPDFQDPHPAQTMYFDDIQIPSSNASAPTNVNVTFRVNAANVTTHANGLYVGGGTQFGSFNTNQMTQIGATDVWEITLPVIRNAETDYTFINGGTGWGDKESIVGQSCAVAPHSDRRLPAIWNDTTILACFQDCSVHDASCPAPPVVTEPTTAAPTPTHTVAGDGVISIYSNAYTSIGSIDYSPPWGQTTVRTDVVIAGDDAMKYANLNYQGTDWDSNPQDLSDNAGLPAPGYTYYLHLDYWANTSITAPQVTIVTGTWPDNKEYLIDFANFSAEAWGSVDIPLSDFYNGNNDMNLNDVKQLKVTAGGNGNLWVDNIYFYKSTAVAVPVELTSFSAREEASVNILEWATASELDNSHFEVERSTNGVDFEAIGTVEGNGTTFETQNYTFTDESPIGVAYYRLRQVDFDGAYEYSKVALVKRNAIDVASVKLYPMPVRSNLTIDYTAMTNEDIAITVTDVMGRTIMNTVTTATIGENQLNIDLKTLPAGSYFVQLLSSTNTSTHSIIKQ